MSLYLKVSPHGNYDDFYFKLTETENTWKEILGYIETCLDDQYLDNDNSLKGIQLSLEITESLHEDVEIDL